MLDRPRFVVHSPRTCGEVGVEPRNLGKMLIVQSCLAHFRLSSLRSNVELKTESFTEGFNLLHGRR